MLLGLLQKWRWFYRNRRASEVLFSLHCNALLQVWDCSKASYCRQGRVAPGFPMILNYIGLSIAMTLVKLPRERDYWYGPPLRGACRMPNFNDVMPHHKFIEIGSMLRFAMPSDKDPADAGWKARINSFLFSCFSLSKSFGLNFFNHYLLHSHIRTA